MTLINVRSLTSLVLLKGDLRILDLQFLSSGDPIFDLGMIIFFNTNVNFMTEPARLEHLLGIYHSAFNKMLDQLGCPSSKESLANIKQRFLTVGKQGATLFGLLSYDIMIIYEKLVERFYSLIKLDEKIFDK